jgi:hypothetical protein
VHVSARVVFVLAIVARAVYALLACAVAHSGREGWFFEVSCDGSCIG